MATYPREACARLERPTGRSYSVTTTVSSALWQNLKMAKAYEQDAPTWSDQASPDNQRDFAVQSIISIAFGVAAILAFCVRLSGLFFDMTC